MRSIDEEINKVTQTITDANNMLAVMAELMDHEYVNLATYFASDNLRITVKNLSDLSKIRKMLRDVRGHWEDEMVSQFVSCNYFITTWHSKDKEEPIAIWYECPHDNINEKLQKPGCKVVKNMIAEYSYVCNVDK